METLKTNITMKTIKTYLPVFPGFYGTIFEYENEEFDIENYNEENNTDLNFDDFEFNYKDYYNRVAKKCCEIIERELKHLFPSVSVKFESLVSPREYNFTNDSINVEISIDNQDFETMLTYLKTNKKEFKGYIKEMYSNCSGFISFYSTDYKVWLDEYLKEDNDKLTHCFGSVLNFILNNEGFIDDDLYDNLDGENYIEFEVIEKL